jgi:predicted MPP superfamily phosphohydrolase
MSDMRDLSLRRQLIERGQLKARLPHAGGMVFQKNLHFLRFVLRAGLWVVGIFLTDEDDTFNPILRSIRFELDTLPEGLCGFTILHLSDFHLDGNPRLAERLSERLRDFEVDVCVLTGDYRFALHGPCPDFYRRMETILTSIKAQYGIVGILGNHDSLDMAVELERMGVKMLVNEAWEVRGDQGSAWFIGLDDPYYFGCDDLPSALKGVPHEAFKILLVHTPELIEDAHRNGVSLYLCGHTHGGQVCFPLIGPLVVNVSCPRRYTRGVWQYQNVQGYTNAGVGSAPIPFRFRCPPEIGLIELRRPGHRDSESYIEPDRTYTGPKRKSWLKAGKT